MRWFQFFVCNLRATQPLAKPPLQCSANWILQIREAIRTRKLTKHHSLKLIQNLQCTIIIHIASPIVRSLIEWRKRSCRVIQRLLRVERIKLLLQFIVDLISLNVKWERYLASTKELFVPLYLGPLLLLFIRPCLRFQKPRKVSVAHSYYSATYFTKRSCTFEMTTAHCLLQLWIPGPSDSKQVLHGEKHA